MAKKTSIERILERLEKKILEQTDTNPAKEILTNVLKRLISAHDKDEAAIMSTLNYLRNIAFMPKEATTSEPILLYQHLGMKESKKPTTQSNDQPLPYHDISFFADIYNDLLRVYSNIVAWEYKFPLDKTTGSADHPILKKWCKELVIDESHVVERNEDFSRGIGLFGTRPRSTTEGETLLHEKMQETDYPEAQKAMLVKWVKINGDQRIYSIITDLALDKSFSDNFTMPGFTKNIGANWFIKDGTVQFFFASDYFSLHNENHRHLVMLKNEEAKVVEREDAAELYKDNKLSPLMRAEVRLEFDVTANKVTPKITELVLTSYTSALKSPGHDNTRTPSPIRR